MSAGALNAAARTAAIAELRAARELDVLVIGGGVVGAGAALDAAQRGLAVAIVEQHDWASGTSSRSSKLIHGGLRYLEMLDFGLVREALHERGLQLTRLAPHLVHPVPFLFPLRGAFDRAYVGAGVLLYDVLSAAASGRGLPFHRHVSQAEALRAAPALRPSALRGAVQYWDALVDDARHTMMLVRTAARYGARAISRARVTGLLRDGEAVVGAQVCDDETGASFPIRARRTILATGVWSDAMTALADAPAPFHVRASRGVHIVVARERIAADTGIILRTESSVLFVIPWGAHWIIGTTDTDDRGALADPAAGADDVAYLLEHVNRVLETPLTRADVEGVYAGLRPLVARGSGPSARVPRTHVVAAPRPGLIAVAGGKYTTYRVMAKDAVDAAVVGFAPAAPPSMSASAPLLGANGYAEACARRAQISAQYGLSDAQVTRVLERYGSLIDEVLVAEPGALLHGAPYLRAEIVYAVTHEDARHLADVMERRTRLAFETRDGGLAAADEIARLMAHALGWTADERDAEVAAFRASSAHDRRALDTARG